MRLQPVYYTRDAKTSKHIALIRDYIMTEEVDRAAWGSIDGVFENCRAASSAYKHISFKSEKEVRLVSLPFSPRYLRYIRSLNPDYEKIKVTRSDCPLR